MTLQRRRRRNADIFDTGPFGAYNNFGYIDDGGDSGGGSGNGGGSDYIPLDTYAGVVAAYSAGQITWQEAYNLLVNTFGESDNDANYALDIERETITSEYEQRQIDLAEAYNPQLPSVDYEAGTYLLPKVGNATAAGQPIPTNTAYKYWDGNLNSHDWATHGYSTPKASGVKDGGHYPQPMVDSFGGYAVSLSHYIASYDPNGAFLGFRVLTASELAGGIPAGIPMATVMQMFTKCAKTRTTWFRDNDFANDGFNFILDTENKPIWRKALDMPMNPKSFFFVEEELATESKIDIPDGGLDNTIVWQNTHPFSPEDFESTYDTGYNDTPTVFTKSSFAGNKARAKTLNRQFRRSKWYPEGLFTQGSGGKSKVNYGVKMEWLGEDGRFGTYSTHPESIPDCDPDQGKTMLIYRFPRQLDPVVDKNLLEYYAANGMPDYSLTATGDCYPMPGVTKHGTIESTDKYGLVGRLAPVDSDTLDAEKFEAEYNGRKYAGRRKINLVPMISANLPPSDRHRPYLISQSIPLLTFNDASIYAATDWFCFDTSNDVITGAAISVTDPYKKAYLGSGRLTNAYFPKADLDVGSTAFAIGQCMLAYDMASPSIDAKLGENNPVVNLPHGSERIIITTESGKMDSAAMPFRSNEQDPIGRPTDGSQAGNFKSDYLPPIQVITTQDLVNMEATPPMPEPVGMAAIRDAWKKTMGTELTAASFAALPNIGAFDNPTKYGVRDPNNPLNYIINTNYGTFSFPFTIAIFQVPLHHRGPVLKYSDEVDTNGNLKPLESSSEKPGYIGTKDVRLVYQSPFGEVNSSVINLDRQIQRQLDTVELLLDEDGNPILDEDGNPIPLPGEVSDLFKEQTDEGGIDEGQYTEDEQEIFTERQFRNWMYDKLMEDYGDVKWTSTPFRQHFHLWNKDYVTGKMLLEKFGSDPGFKLPGVDYSLYEAEAAKLNIQMVSQVTDEESQDDQSANISGLGAFTNSQGFTVTDVTAKWGTMEAANARYTGDVGMSMVPYEANVKNEQLGYMAMSNLSGLGYPGEGVIDDAKGFAADVTMEAAKWSGLGVGLGLGGAVMILAGGVAVGIAAKESGKAVWTILNKKSPNSI